MDSCSPAASCRRRRCCVRACALHCRLPQTRIFICVLQLAATLRPGWLAAISRVTIGGTPLALAFMPQALAGSALLYCPPTIRACVHVITVSVRRQSHGLYWKYLSLTKLSASSAAAARRLPLLRRFAVWSRTLLQSKGLIQHGRCRLQLLLLRESSKSQYSGPQGLRDSVKIVARAVFGHSKAPVCVDI